MATRSRSKYQSTSGQAGTASAEDPVAKRAMAGDPEDATVRALPGGNGNRRETGALDVQTVSPAPLSETSDRSPHSEEEDDHPYMTVRGRGSHGSASPTPSLKDVTGNVTRSPSGPATFPGWFREGNNPNSSLEDVTIRNSNVTPERERQTRAETAYKGTSVNSPQVPQLEFEDFTENVMAGLDGLDPAAQQAVRARMNLVFNDSKVVTQPSTPRNVSPTRSIAANSATEPTTRFTAAERGSSVVSPSRLLTTTKASISHLIQILQRDSRLL